VIAIDCHSLLQQVACRPFWITPESRSQRCATLEQNSLEEVIRTAVWIVHGGYKVAKCGVSCKVCVVPSSMSSDCCKIIGGCYSVLNCLMSDSVSGLGANTC
jgi:hypothetical protein